MGKATVQEQIHEYMAAQGQPKSGELQDLHRMVLNAAPECQLWFLDGKDSQGKTVSNPNIGYGIYTLSYADGSTREFYRIGLSANKTGISVYILGLEDKTYLARTYGTKLGKASVTGYCIKFRTLKDIDVGVLEAAVRDRFALPN